MESKGSFSFVYSQFQKKKGRVKSCSAPKVCMVENGKGASVGWFADREKMGRMMGSPDAEN